MTETANNLSNEELQALRKQVSDNYSKTQNKIDNLLIKGKGLTASEIIWLLRKEVSRTDIAKAMNMSRTSFETYLSEHGLTIPKKNQAEKIEEAKKLIRNTELSVREIANKTGLSRSGVYKHYKEIKGNKGESS
ncbi:helix-turn-helix domain-containing protein [Oceanobacillus oncorhynchi]|uniref:helix-turn-helix domain-containing protein n=1 Tax=Oceanobacillus oncorhynchi TaxID=545501 RepID=UPI001866A018|nr:helix-turn-helix transcriptional regulator [Oceanobacillus oncorhynchi]